MNLLYQRAVQRPDLSLHLVHLCKEQSPQSQPYEQLLGILHDEEVKPSEQEYVKRYCDDSAACFSDVPPALWPDLVRSNPSSRQPFGLIVDKTAFWKLGGRPVIYTEQSDPSLWPEQERYRLCHTDLMREPYPIDWMHEREWRIRGGLRFSDGPSCIWWWPMVPDFPWLHWLAQSTGATYSAYVLSAGNVYSTGSGPLPPSLPPLS